MQEFKESFDTLLWVKLETNDHEKWLFKRAEKYIKKLAKIPGIEMIAIVNSLSMYATHKDSDIDLFIVTKPNMIWFVRFFSTLILWRHGVWRKNEDIAGNFCLSFFITTESMDFREIAIQDDIYLYYWTYYMKPIISNNDTYEEFLKKNTWVQIDETQKSENIKYMIQKWENHYIMPWLYRRMNRFFKHFLHMKSMQTYLSIWSPKGVIISDTMLKFHNKDKREVIRDNILKKNFDK